MNRQVFLLLWITLITASFSFKEKQSIYCKGTDTISASHIIRPLQQGTDGDEMIRDHEKVIQKTIKKIITAVKMDCRKNEFPTPSILIIGTLIDTATSNHLSHIYPSHYFW